MSSKKRNTRKQEKKQKSEIVVGITYNVNVRKNKGRKSG